LERVKQDQVTKPDLTNQVLPAKEEDIVAKAQRVMGDSYQPPAVKLFDYGD